MYKFIAYAIYIFTKLVSYTYRFRYMDWHNLEKAEEQHPEKSYIVGIWHQNLIGGILSKMGKRRGHSCLVSPSKDGDLVAYTLKKLGHQAARGSSSRDGKKGKDHLIELINQGYPGAITVDGPLGPPKEVKNGIIEIARRTKAPVVPYIVYGLNCWTLNSWDKFKVPKPFSRIIVKYGSPFKIPYQISKDDFEKAKERLQKELIEGEKSIREIMT